MKKLLLTALTVVLSLNIYAQGTIDTTKSIKSEILSKPVNYTVYLPEGYKSSEKYPVLYLLHGYGGDHTSWSDEELGNMKAITDSLVSSKESVKMVIIMPNAWNSWYVNDISGKFRYEDMFFDELVPHIEKTYSISTSTDSTFIAGLSMGGNASLLYTMKHPGRFGVCYAMSPAVMSNDMISSWNGSMYDNLFGKERPSEHYKKNNVLDIANTYAQTHRDATLFFIDCGDDDFLFEGVSELYIKMRKAKLPLEYRIYDGDHNWSYWRRALTDALKYISHSLAPDTNEEED